MSVLDDFARIRLYRERASEFEWLADNEPISDVRLRYRVIGRHYSELAYREEQSDKAKMVERLKQLKQNRAELAKQKGLPAPKPSYFLLALPNEKRYAIRNGSARVAQETQGANKGLQ